jgi:hypothetical protein
MKPLVTEEGIVRQADQARPTWLFVWLVLALFFFGGMTFVFSPPVNRWLHTHREFVLGVLAGSMLELIVIYGSRWAWDRVLWMKWFSHQ